MKKIKKLVITLFLLSGLISLNSQTKITGKIQDEKGNPIPSSTLKVINPISGTKTDNNGNYTLILPNGGNFEIEISSLGFKKETINITIAENETINKNITLETSSKKVKKVTVKGQKVKSTESATLEEQKQKTQIVEIIGSQEMSRKGASDAQSAVTKMAGISKEEGSSQIFVRGLGDRYNSTMLNGMFLPSDNPEFKNISLEYFPAEIIQSIGVSKTYNNTLLGDFGGATIDIATKEFYGKPFFNLELKTGLNTQAISNFKYRGDVSYFGQVSNQEIPTYTENKFVERDWNLREMNTPNLNNGLQVNGGWSKIFKNDMKLSLFGTASFTNKFQYFSGLSKVIYAFGGVAQSFIKNSHVYTVNKNAMVNATMVFNPKFKTKFNFLGFTTAGSQMNEYIGYDNGINDSIYRRRTINDISNLYVFQLINEYKANEKLSFNLSGAMNFIENNQPNRLTTSLTVKDGKYAFLKNYSGDHSSYYQLLQDKDNSINLGSKYKLMTDSTEDKLTLNIAYTFRYKDRAFTQSDFIYRPSTTLNANVNPSNIDEAFSESNFNNTLFTMEDDLPGNKKIDINKYNGQLFVHSPSIALDFIPNKKNVLNFGIRIDMIDQTVDWNVVTATPQTGVTKFNSFKVLPFINAKHIISEKENVKMAFSKTYTLPQFKELAPFLYYDISTYNTRGNPYVYASDNYNLDIKYEWFPSKSELISLGGFGKFIQNPINKIFEASSGLDQMIFANSGEQATVFGAEFELKKKIYETTNDSGMNHSFHGGFNISALYSNQDLNKDKIDAENNKYTSAIFTNTSSAIQGASPLIFNIDLSYKMKTNKLESQYSLVFNYFMDRLYALGAAGAGNVYENGIPSLDLITRHKFNEKMSLSLNFRNLLNPSIERYQEVPKQANSTISSFKKGLDLSLGLSYSF